MTNLSIPPDLRAEIVAALRKRAKEWIARLYRHEVLVARTVRGMQIEAREAFEREVVRPIVQVVAGRLSTFDLRGNNIVLEAFPELRALAQEVEQIAARGADAVRRLTTQRLAALVDQEAEWLGDTARRSLQVDIPDPRVNAGEVLRRPWLGDSTERWFAKALAVPSADNARRVIQTGLQQGWPEDQIVRSLRGTPDQPGALAGPVRMVETLVRTAATAASAQSRIETFKAIGVTQWRFVATLDERTSLQCFDGSVRATPIGQIIGVFVRPYDGQFVVIRTAAGKQMRATPNHPILTSDGWLPAHELRPGKQVVYTVAGDGLCVDCRQHVGVPPTLSEIADAASKRPACNLASELAAALDFHGDGPPRDGNVDVLRPGGDLMLDFEPSATKGVGDDLLGRPDLRGILAGCGAEHPRRGRGGWAHVSAKLPPTAAQRGVDGGGRPAEGLADGLWSDALIEQSKDLVDALLREGGGCPAGLGIHDPSTLEHGSDGGGGRPELPCQRCGRGTAPVLADDVVDVSVELGRAHVYNLETSSGTFIANGCIVHNCASQDGKVYAIGEGPVPPLHPACRSVATPYYGEPIGQRASVDGPVPADTTFRQWLEDQPKDVQNEVLGRTRADAWRAGKLPFDKMVGRDMQPLTVAELRRLDRIPGEG